MFTNKHVIAALIVTPILAILAYFAVDSVVSEKPHKAVAGASYELIAKPNCRYSSGICTLKNGDMELNITLQQQDNGQLLTLTSAVPLSGVTLSLSKADAKASPLALSPVAGESDQWQGHFTLDYAGDEILRLVASADGAFYYGETIAAFGHYETSYGKDFR